MRPIFLKVKKLKGRQVPWPIFLLTDFPCTPAYRPFALLPEPVSFVPVPICGAKQQQLEKNVSNKIVMGHWMAIKGNERSISAMNELALGRP